MQTTAPFIRGIVSTALAVTMMSIATISRTTSANAAPIEYVFVSNPSVSGATGEVTLDGMVLVSGWFTPAGGSRFDLMGAPSTWQQDGLTPAGAGQFGPLTTLMGLASLTLMPNYSPAITGQLWSEVILPAEAPPQTISGSGRWEQASTGAKVPDTSPGTAWLLVLALASLTVRMKGTKTLLD